MRDIAVKASSVDRAFSMGKLYKRLGEFEERMYPDSLEEIVPEPESSIYLEAWKCIRKSSPETRKGQKQRVMPNLPG